MTQNAVARCGVNSASQPASPNIGIVMAVASAGGIATPDLGGKATTQEETSVVCEAVRGVNLPEGARA
jgi:hypothetical protein